MPSTFFNKTNCPSSNLLEEASVSPCLWPYPGFSKSLFLVLLEARTGCSSPVVSLSRGKGSLPTIQLILQPRILFHTLGTPVPGCLIVSLLSARTSSPSVQICLPAGWSPVCTDPLAIPSQVQDSSFLWQSCLLSSPAQVPLDGSTTTWSIRHSYWFWCQKYSVLNLVHQRFFSIESLWILVSKEHFQSVLRIFNGTTMLICSSFK